MQQDLRTIEQLLREYGLTYQANLAMIAAERFAESPAEACAEINTDEWWGDRDAIAAVDLAVQGGFSPRARDDSRRLREALIRVYATLKAYGEKNEQAELMAMQFDKWLNSRA